ncbi:hypothetical protein C8R45DRAFT_229771 [Mycena sanguinolenta]|nr:hypothetical protein C8R45DRAFT_229771 [Mycena sanguinolenta]
MATLPLPQVPLVHGIPPPIAPQNPPTLLDITNARDYNERLQAARNAAKHGPANLMAPTALDIAQGLIYEKTPTELVGGPEMMPAWFQAWDANHFQPLKQAVEDIHIDLLTFRGQFANTRCATGHQAPFQMVPFVNGDDPTALPHSLPTLENTDDIKGLNPPDVTAYLTGYGLSTQGNPVVRIRRLARHIGYFGDL